MFSILDVMWMMLCFFGMRRRSSQSNNATTSMGRGLGEQTVTQAFMQGLMCQGLNDSPSGGNAAILLVTVTHLAASLVLAPNSQEDGCKISLPCLGGVVIWVGMLLRRVTTRGHFLPEDQRMRIQGMQLGGLRTVGGSSHHVE